MTDFAWPNEMAPTPMLPQGMSQQQLYQLLHSRGFQVPQQQFPQPPPMWPTPQGSPPFNDPTQWMGTSRNALLTPDFMKQLLSHPAFVNALARRA